MSFRKRDVVLRGNADTALAVDQNATEAAGVRPSPLDGRPTTSTGTASLDALLGGFAGVPLGTSLLIEETGTTDYASILLRYFAAEGLAHGQAVHVVGVPDAWGRDLPGIVQDGKSDTSKQKVPAQQQSPSEKMKIAWRYEGLGEFGTRRAPNASTTANQKISNADTDSSDPFCHSYDLTKRLDRSLMTQIKYVALPSTAHNPFDAILTTIRKSLAASPKTIHRLILPSFLSPALYPAATLASSTVLSFLHALRTLTRQYSTQLVASLSLPLDLYSRRSPLIRWIELLIDAVCTLSPFPYSLSSPPSADPASKDEVPLGLVHMQSLPVLTERGAGLAAAGGDMAFTVTRKRFSILPYNLPPVEGDSEAQQAAMTGEGQGQGMAPKVREKDLEF